jgi:hypothetical protein
MKKNHFIARRKLGGYLILGVAALTLASCAQDGFDNGERFTTVSGITLESPNADSIVVTPDASGAKQTISWPVVFGAGGYIVSVYDVTTPDKPVAVDSIENKLVDGTAITLSRKEDTYYKFLIKSAANAKANNAESTKNSEITYNTYTPTYKTIPDGTDLTQYFAANALPADSTSNDLSFDLADGGNYTMSGIISPGLNKITLRCTNKNKRPTIKFTGNAGFVMDAGLTLKNINFDCGTSTSSFVSMNATPLVTNVIGGNYFLQDKLNIQSCNIDNVNNYFVYDNKQKVYVENVVVNNCIVHLTPATTLDAVFYLNKGGNILSLTVSNSTFYETGSSDYKYFYQTNGRAKNVNYISNTTTYANSTFYNVCNTGQWGNYNGMAGQSNSYWNMTDCIFAYCSPTGVARRFLAGKKTQKTATFKNNTYMQKGAIFDDPSGYDDTGTDIKEDPVFKNPDGADFTISNAAQVSAKTGDPRWLPSAE